MAEKNINSRIQQKHDIESNWLKAINFIPKQGELIVYDIDENHNYERIKIGDGITTVSSLPFIDDTKANKTDIIQADWNQNNNTALDYVKNRTHWVEDDGETYHSLDEKFIPDTIARKSELNNLDLITVEDIDAICGTNIQYANMNEVTF